MVILSRFRYPLFISLLLAIIIAGIPVSAESFPDIHKKQFSTYIIPNEPVFFSLNHLEVGDSLYVSAVPISGNLDPVIALAPDSIDIPDFIGEVRDTVNNTMKHGGDIVESGKTVTNKFFLTWDDDSGPEYSSELLYTLPDSGNYLLVLMSNPFSRNFGNCRVIIEIKKQYTYPYQPGISHAPEIFRNTSILSDGTQVQIINSSLIPGEKYREFILNQVFQDDRLFISASSHDTIPFRVLLRDFGGKILATSEYLGTSNSTMQYAFRDSGNNYRIEVRPQDMARARETIPFLLVTSLNNPSVLSGDMTERGRDVVQLPIKVKIGLEIDQITKVDQREENFAIVGNIWMQWTDPNLAFSPWSCNCSRKTYQSIESFIEAEGTNWPDFSIYNQQERRWTQNILISLSSDGNATYYEKFWDTLQAPDFDFRNYPFDAQSFYVKIDALYPLFRYEFVPWPEKTRIGNQLGEEEWIVTSSGTNISTVNLTDVNSRYIFHFSAVRQIQYYIFRIIIPILIILMLTYISFLLTDYAKRAEIASANLLILVAYSFMIGDDIPRLGYLTFLDIILVISFIITGMTTIYNFYLKWVADAKKKALAERIDKVMVWLYPVIYLVSILMLLLSEQVF